MDYENATQDKLVILHTIKRLSKSITNLQMVDLILESTGIDYFTLQELLLELENKELRKENKALKREIKRLKGELPPDTVNRIEIIKWVRDKGWGLKESRDALELFGYDAEKAVHYLQIRGDAVCRRKPNGKKWTEQDYIDYVNSFDF
jgi:DNA-binding transcriptional MerR regulator